MGKYIYVMQSGKDDYKIGVSSDPMKRLKGLQTGAFKKVNMIFSIWNESPFVYEKILHNKYKDFHTIGEWFKFEDKSFVKEIVNLLLADECSGKTETPKKVSIGDPCEVASYIEKRRVVAVRDIPRNKNESDVVVSNTLKEFGCVKRRLQHGQFYITPHGFHSGLTELSMPKSLRIAYEEDK